VTDPIAKVARCIQDHPGRTKSELAALVGARKQSVLAAVDTLLGERLIKTGRDRGRTVYFDASFPGSEGTPEPGTAPAFDDTAGTGAGSGSRPAPGPSTFASPAKDRDVPQRTGADKPGGLALVAQPRCRCCRDPGLRDRINRMIAGGFSLRAIYEGLAAVNTGLPSNRRITVDSLQTHRSRHFDVQVGASAVWRRILEERLAADAVNYENGVMSLVTPRLYLETVVTRGYANLIDENAQVTLGEGLAAARELAKLAANDDQDQRWAEIHATQNRIIEVMRSLDGEAQQIVLAKLDGRPWPPPSGAPVLALVEGTVDDDQQVEPFGDEDADFDDLDTED
jgi:hypothetical protein